MQVPSEIPGLAVPADKISKGSTALLYSRSKHLLYALRKALVARRGNPAGRAGRANAGQEQRFIGVNITNTDDHPGVHDEVLYRPPAPARAAIEQLAVKLGRQRLRTQIGQQRMALARRQPQKATETAGVVKAQTVAAGQRHIDMVVPGDGVPPPDHPQRTGHAQVHQCNSRGSLEQQVLGATLNRQDDLPGHTGCQGVRHRPAQTRFAHYHRAHRAPATEGFDTAAGGFNLGQFGH